MLDKENKVDQAIQVHIKTEEEKQEEQEEKSRKKWEEHERRRALEAEQAACREQGEAGDKSHSHATIPSLLPQNQLHYLKPKADIQKIKRDIKRKNYIQLKQQAKAKDMNRTLGKFRQLEQEKDPRARTQAHAHLKKMTEKTA